MIRVGETGDGAVERQSLFLPPRAVRKAYHPLSVPSTWFPLAAAGLYLPKLHRAWDVATSGELLRGGWLMKLRDGPRGTDGGWGQRLGWDLCTCQLVCHGEAKITGWPII